MTSEYCGRIQENLDSYLSQELGGEAQQEVKRHVGQCIGCATELEIRERIRRRLKAAVEAETAPPRLEAAIRRRIRGSERPAWVFLRAPSLRWAVPVAAAVLVGLGLWNWQPWDRMPGYDERLAQDSFIHRVADRVAGVFRPGLKDHLHCAVFRKFPAQPPPAEKLGEALGTEYEALVPLLETKVSGDYKIWLAHQCTYQQRRYVHVILRVPANMISLVITRKAPGESFVRERIQPMLRASGMPVYRTGARDWEVAGFETRDFLVYVVSDLGQKRNLQVAAALAPEVRDLLARLES